MDCGNDLLMDCGIANAHTRQEMDHWSDPLGTESPHMRFDQNQWPKVDLLEVVSKWIKYTLSSGFSA